MHPASPPTTLSEAAYRQIRAMVLGGEIEPGEKLKLEALAGKVGMGTTPLREALSRLSTEGLVVAQGQRGYWAAPVSAAEYLEITDLRVDLECKAFARAMRQGDVQWESAVVAAFHRLSHASARLASTRPIAFAEWERHNRDFHMALIEGCGHAWLLRFTRMLFDQSERYRQLGLATRAVPLTVNDDEHAALMQAALARDVRRGTRLLREHIEHSARAAIRAIFGDADANGRKP